MRASAEQLQQRVASLEVAAEAASRAVDAGASAAAEKDAEAARLKCEAEAATLSAEATTAQLEELRLSLAEAKSQTKASSERLRLAKEEQQRLSTALHETQAARCAADQRVGELESSTAEFRSQAKQALEDARQNIRIMVTAPKVSINVGGNNKDLHAPFPFSAIQRAVENDVMPKFAKVAAVADGAGDSEIRQNVQQMVESLALTLQTKVHELVPAAEGTCNWDGFGAKCGGLRT